LEALARTLLDGFERDSPALEELARLGEPEPQKAATALRRAIAHPDLADSATRWLPTLLRSARPGFAAATLPDLADRYRETCGRPLDPDTVPAAPLVLGSSAFLARLLLRHAHWADELRSAGPDTPPPAPSLEPIEAAWTAIRVAKYRGLLRIAARDLMERADFSASLDELSALADRCLVAALRCSEAETGHAAPALLALGKLGGSELNFSSDVDVLFLYGAPQIEDPSLNPSATEFIRHFKTHLEVPSEDGFAYRVDLDLRPEGTQGPLANASGAALDYYETFGAEWERQMLVRLRPVGGAEGVGEGFADAVAPFVYRRLIDPGAVHAARGMKARIESERRRAGRDLTTDLKEGPGGIRDVEFLVQALQLFYGARHAELRTGNVCRALTALGGLGLLPAIAVEELRHAYLWLRRAEHCMQLVEERQVHAFPKGEAQQNELARRMGYADADIATARTRLLDDWNAVKADVRMHFDRLVLEADTLRSVLEPEVEGTPLAATFEVRSAPLAEKPSDTSLSSGPAARGLARALASNAATGRYLAARPALLEEIATAQPGDLEARADTLAGRLGATDGDDLEAALDELRMFRRDETVRAACFDLSGQVPFESVSLYLSRLAEACLSRALDLAVRQSRGPAAALGILGMGKSAGRELTYSSDLDVIFLYDEEQADGQDAARLAQRLIAYLTTMTRAGVAYEIDSRLRPSGQKGTLVTTYAAFAQYQRERAAVWEHLALLRTRAIGGSAEAEVVCHRVQEEVLSRRGAAWDEVASMRLRVEQERGRPGSTGVPYKAGRGGLMDVDFLASGAMLELRKPLPADVLPSVPAMLRACTSGPRLDRLIADYAFLRRVESRARWVAARGVERVPLTGESAPLVAELVEPGLTPEALGSRLDETRERVRSAFDAVTGAGSIGALSA